MNTFYLVEIVQVEHPFYQRALTEIYIFYSYCGWCYTMVVPYSNYSLIIGFFYKIELFLQKLE